MPSIAHVTAGDEPSATHQNSLVDVVNATALHLIAEASGTSTAAGATNVQTVAIATAIAAKGLEALTAKDRLIFSVIFEEDTQSVGAITLHNTTDGVSIATILSGMTAGQVYCGKSIVGQSQSAATRIICHMSAGYTLAQTQASTFTTSWVGGAFSIALRHAGVTAGGTFRYRLWVHLERGQ